jgi:haloalkane dehalogenase
MTVLRTPDDRFTDLSGYPFEPHYQEIEDPDLGSLRIHFVDEGPRDGEVVLCLHGEPSWSYLYRKMIPVFAQAGRRVLAPDLVGFGRSDKPVEREAYTYKKHVEWMKGWLKALDLRGITLVAQDWGGLIGLRLVAEMPERFARVSLSNTGLLTGDQQLPESFFKWQRYSQTNEEFDPGHICNDFGRGSLTAEEQAAYRAPFPSEEYKAGIRQFPMLVPASPQDPATEANRAAWQVLRQWDKPVLLCFAADDPIFAGGDEPLKKLIPGTQGQPHRTLHGGHFIQEKDGVTWAEAVVEWTA